MYLTYLNEPIIENHEDSFYLIVNGRGFKFETIRYTSSDTHVRCYQKDGTEIAAILKDDYRDMPKFECFDGVRKKVAYF